MKNIIKIVCLALVLCGTSSCIGNFEEYNTDPYKIYRADPPILLSTMIETLMYVQQNRSQNVDQMVGSLGGYFTVSNRWGGQNFDTFNASDAWNALPYNTTFQMLYSNFFDIEKSTNKSGHYYAMGCLLRAAAMMRIVDSYGAIPYSKVAHGTFYVEYDKAEDVYKYIIEDLSKAATVLNSYATDFPGSKPMAGNDAIYDGDYMKWARLANSLILRAAMRSGNQEAFESACTHAAGLIEDNAQNALMSPGSQPNPYFLAASASWTDLHVNGSIVDYMVGYDDPRCGAYFMKSTFDPAKYIGMPIGEASFEKPNIAGYSLPNIATEDRLPVFVAAETNFLRAEAALNGWAVGNTAQYYYEAGVTLSMGQHGVKTDVIATYLADELLKPASHVDPRGAKYTYNRKTELKIKWNDGASDAEKLERIITQKWIANYPLGIEAWTEYRRTGYPELAPSIDNLSSVITNKTRGMRRLRYPYTEKNLNSANYDLAVSMLGGADNEATDLFWAKKN